MLFIAHQKLATFSLLVFYFIVYSVLVTPLFLFYYILLLQLLHNVELA